MSAVISLPYPICRSQVAIIGILATQSDACKARTGGAFGPYYEDWAIPWIATIDPMDYDLNTVVVGHFDTCGATSPDSVTNSAMTGLGDPTGWPFQSNFNGATPASGLGDSSTSTIGAGGVAFIVSNPNATFYAVYNYYGSANPWPLTAGACQMQQTFDGCNSYYYLPPPPGALFPIPETDAEDYYGYAPVYYLFASVAADSFGANLGDIGMSEFSSFQSWCTANPGNCDPSNLTPPMCQTSGDPFFGDDPP